MTVLRRRLILTTVLAAAATCASTAQPTSGLTGPGGSSGVMPAVPPATAQPAVTAGPQPSPWLDPELNAGPPSDVQFGTPAAKDGALNRLVPAMARDIADGEEARKAADKTPVAPVVVPTGGSAGPDSMQNEANRPTRSGLAPPMDPGELEEALRSRTGPPLPDAQLADHRAEAGEEGELRLRADVLDLRSAVNTKLLQTLEEERKIRIALAQAKLPIRVTAQGEVKTPEGPIEAEPPRPAPAPLRPDESNVAGTEIQRPTGVPDPVPVVYSIGGVGKHRTADVLVPYGGSHEVSEGSMLPHDLRVVAVEPFAVVVQGPDGIRRTLPMGRSVPANPATQRAEGVLPGISPQAYSAAPPAGPPPAGGWVTR